MTLTVTGLPIDRRAVQDGERLGPLVDRAGGAGDGGVERHGLAAALKVADALAAAVAVAAALMVRVWLVSV